MNGSIYDGPSELLEAAEVKGYICVEENIELNSIIKDNLEDISSQNSVPIRVINLKGWLKFLKDVNERTSNAAESSFTEEMIFVFGMISDKFEDDKLKRPVELPTEEQVEKDNKKTKKEIIGDSDIKRLRAINFIDELLKEENGFFG